MLTAAPLAPLNLTATVLVNGRAASSRTLDNTPAKARDDNSDNDGGPDNSDLPPGWSRFFDEEGDVRGARGCGAGVWRGRSERSVSCLAWACTARY